MNANSVQPVTNECHPHSGRSGFSSMLPIAAILLMLQPVTLLADSYFSIEGSSVTLHNDVTEDLSPGGLRFRLGTQLSELLDVEGHLGFSFTDDTESYDGIGATYMGAYLKAYVPVGERSALFAVGGWSTVEISQEINDGTFSESRSGLSYGFGMETQLTRNADLTADYMLYLRDENLFEEVSALSIGIKLYF